MPLTTYRKKRDFRKTPEPKGGGRTARRRPRLAYVIQKHAASHLHYDFRLELDGVLKSWAVPKGPSLNPAEKRLAVEVEDHPVEYGDFEGTIPKGEYGGGSVLLWDRGTWEPVGDPHEGLRRGRLSFDLFGEKLKGKWLLIRMKGRDEDRKPTWLLFKEKDAESRARGDVLLDHPESVKTGRAIEEVGSNGKVWHSDRPSARSARSATPRRATARRTAAGKAATTRTTRARSTSRAAPRTPRIPPLQLATLVSRAPEGDDYLHEIKYDGYRALCRLTRGSASFVTRSGQDWTSRFAALASEAQRLDVDQAVLDGEIVIVEPDGRTSFQALQNSMNDGARGALVYYAFDLLSKDGKDLTKLPLEERKAALRELLANGGDAIRYSDHVVGNGPAVFQEACRRGLEGIVSKRRDAPYRGGRVGSWLKVKCTAQQELVIAGYTEPQGSRTGFGALLLGVRDGAGTIRYAGRVGTGFTHESLLDLTRRLRALETKESPLTGGPRSGRGIHWVEPKLVAEVAFTGWTDDGKLRHPSFQGLREDKKPSEARRERPVPPPKPTRKGPPKRDPGKKTPLRDPPPEEPKHPPVREPPEEARAATVAGVAITHPERVLFPEAGITKRDLASYIEAVAERMLPHVKGRPLMLVRCPEGRTGGCFFQKHPGFAVPPAVRQIRVRESKGNATYLAVSNVAGLVGLIQVGVIEIHIWGAREDRQDAPDRLVFDLDPDPSVPWPRTVRAALDLRERLRALDLESFPKTTGGKGLHVVAPFRRGPSWDDVARVGSAVAASMIQDDPDGFTATLSKARRRGKILIDTLRNRRGATWVAPYSPRAREGAPVSMPLAWSEVTPALKPSRFTVRTAAARLRTKDPWSAFLAVSQSLPRVRL
ncbi:MAG TPA: DNA ligase D [Candidatus Eisenbacteria bacterium]|jgi:bifunctional non-homologous end joining protein LigD|nr:DNA ligase D [Candidatus Eisenbacteria bacterium]